MSLAEALLWLWILYRIAEALAGLHTLFTR
jgi:hypothetical protein